jgi:hypothetical protein
MFAGGSCCSLPSRPRRSPTPCRPLSPLASPPPPPPTPGTYDGRSQDPKRHFYHKTCLGPPSNGALFKDYDVILKELGHTVVDFLKIDIGGFIS